VEQHCFKRLHVFKFKRLFLKAWNFWRDMLTQLEFSVLNWINTRCSRSVLNLNPLIWVNGKMYLKYKQNTWLDCCVWFLLISTLLFELTQFPILAHERNVNGGVLLGIHFIGISMDVVCKLNFQKHKLEIVTLINQVLRINTDWGMH